MSFMMRESAPELPGTLEWFNVAAPLTLEGLQGKIVLLDFWTYCCINCLHVLPDLRYLEQKYAHDLVVIGVHSPKFPNERVHAQVAHAIARYDIHHAVAHDPEFRVWREYVVRAWPTLVVIDAEGFIAGSFSGEGRRARLDELIARLIAEGQRAGTLRTGPAPYRVAPDAGRALRFPGKVLALGGGRLAISDTGHHRVLLTDPAGAVTSSWGQGVPGFQDGPPAAAAFHAPQGLCQVGETLFVADTGNHALRAIDLATQTVRTVAGTGVQGRYPGDYFDDARRAPLNSPWDLAWSDGRLFIAMAGPHQIWVFEPELGAIGVYAGTGREALLDGSREAAAFAQPSGLALDARRGQLYVADSETSALRRVDLRAEQVYTLAGQGLFEFGDQDGSGAGVRLQHPLGIALDVARNRLWLADSYNHKIKYLDIVSNVITSYPVAVKLEEPGGLSFDDPWLWVANTNAHEVVGIDVDRGVVREVSCG